MEKQLAFEYIKSRKKKNIIALITIMLVTIFLTAVCLYGYSYNMMTKNKFISAEGSYHGTIVDVKSEDFSKIEKHATVKSYGEIMPVYAENNDSEDIYYDYYDKISLGYYDLEVTEGTYPSGEFEVAIDRLYGEKYNKKVGDTITVLNKNFKVVGLIDNLKYTRLDEKVYQVYMSESFAKSTGAESLALVELSDIGNYEQDFESIAKLLSLSNEAVVYNETRIAIDNGGLLEIVPFLAIGLLIALSAFFIIYNIFYIVLGERMKTIGLLLTVGITEKQIRKIVLYEAIFLALIAIPVGVLVGTIATKVLISNLYINGDLRFLMNPIILPAVVVLTLLTVLLSVILPAIKVSKLSPIEASRYVEASKTPKKKRKESKNFFTDLAKVNVWRNKKAAVITTISMVLSITLFIVSAAILKSMSIENLAKESFISNVQVDLEYMDVYEGNYITSDIIDPIKAISGVKGVTGLKVISKEGLDNRNEPIIGITDEVIKKAQERIVDGSIDVTEFKKGESAIVPQMHKHSIYKVGDYIEVKDENGNMQKIKVVAVIEEPVVQLGASPSVVYVYNESNLFNKDSKFIKVLVDVKEDDCRAVSTKIESITSKYKNIKQPQNYLDTYDVLKEEKQGIETLGYIIVGVIALIGMMNFVNSTLSGIMARRKELGTLRAVGITDNEIKGILIKEGLYQIGVALTIGVILGNILAFASVYIYKNFMGATFAIYTVPVIETIVCIVVIVALLAIVTRVAINKITKDSVVEQIRFDD